MRSEEAAGLRQCARGKHIFARRTYGERRGRYQWFDLKPSIDEAGRWKCFRCGKWCFRSDIDASAIAMIRLVKRRIRWERSEDENRSTAARWSQLLQDPDGVDSGSTARVDAREATPSPRVPEAAPARSSRSRRRRRTE